MKVKKKMSSIEEPLLDHSPSWANPSPYTNVDLTFSWIFPILALGHQKTLNLNDIPHLNSTNSVLTTFPTLRNNLRSLHNVTNYPLAKTLFLSAWKEILLTAILSVLYTLARYICPYFIDTFLHCLNGGRLKRMWILKFY